MEERSHVSLAVSSIVRICCDKHGDGDWSGRLYPREREPPFQFQNTGQLLDRLDRFDNWLGYPQESVVNRSFEKAPGRERNGEMAGVKRRQIRQKGEKVLVVNEEAMKKHQGDRATLVVRSLYRLNASWQGQVTWAEKDTTVPFRSALELLKLIDSTAVESEDSWDGGDE